MIVDHIGISVKDYQASVEFYTKVLGPVGIEKVMEISGWAGFGREGKAEFWFESGETPTSAVHIAFAADNRAQVDAFYKAALEAGATDNGLPGIREIYHPDYYGAFVIDINGHNLEAVCHRPE